MMPDPAPGDDFTSDGVPPPAASASVIDSHVIALEACAYDAQLRMTLRRSFPGLSNVDDVAQESYVRLINATYTQPIRSVRALLFTIGRRIAIDVLRREQRSPVVFVDDLHAVESASGDDGDNRHAAEDRLSLIAAALAQLPPKSREVIMLCKLQGLSHQEAAERLKLKVKTVDEHVYQGMKRLARLLKPRAGENHGC